MAWHTKPPLYPHAIGVKTPVCARTFYLNLLAGHDLHGETMWALDGHFHFGLQLVVWHGLEAELLEQTRKSNRELLPGELHTGAVAAAAILKAKKAFGSPAGALELVSVSSRPTQWPPSLLTQRSSARGKLAYMRCRDQIDSKT